MLGTLVLLMGFVIMMAGDGSKRAELARNMLITIGVMVVLVLLFGLVARQFVKP
jgi:hypothetical protein